MTINELQNNVIEEFADFDDWMDKYALLIDLGNSLPPLEEKYKTESNLIEGCQSILNGENEGVAPEPGVPVRWAYTMGPSGRADGKCGNFMFNPKLIRL